jgi:hypothetical protein
MDQTSRNNQTSAHPEIFSRLTYPNPFNPSGLDFDLPDDARVTLQIFDHAGMEITTLVDSHFFPRGTHHIDFYTASGEVRWKPVVSTEQGVFFYRLSVEINGARHTDTKKIMFTL